MSKPRVTQRAYNAFQDGDKRVCTACFYVTDTATAATGRHKPRQGDRNVCLNCGHLTIFTGEGLLIREPSNIESYETMQDKEIAGLIAAVRRRGPYR